MAEAKESLSELVQRALQGEVVVIVRRGKPLVQLMPLRPGAGDRRPGSAKGQISMAADFDNTPKEFAEHT